MRKLRLVAALLCIFMIGCSFPILPVAAADVSYASIGAFLEGPVSASVQLKFDSGSFEAGPGFMGGTSPVTFTVSDGMTLHGGTLRYVPVDNYNPILPGRRVTHFVTKVSESETLQLYFQSPTGGGARGGIAITSGGITRKAYIRYDDFIDEEFVPGTDWNEYMLVAPSDNSVAVYTKNDENKWIRVYQGSGYTSDNSPSTGLYFSGQGAVKNATIYDLVTDRYDDIETIIGEEVEVHQEFDFSADTFAFDPEYSVGGVSYSASEGMSLDGGSWTYLPEAGYSPVQAGNGVTFSARASELGSLKICYANPNGGNSYAVMEISPSAIMATKSENVLYFADFGPGTQWVDYLLASNGDVVTLYALDQGKWKILVQSQGCIASDSNGVGLTFSGMGNVKDGAILGEIIEMVPVDEVVTSDRMVWLDEDFISPSNQWSMVSGANVNNGVLCLGGQAGSQAQHPLENYTLGNNFKARFKIKFVSGETHAFYLANGGQRFYVTIRPQTNEISSIGGGTLVGIETLYDTWYEFQMEFIEEDGVLKGSLYRRPAEGGQWRTLWSKRILNDESGRTCIMFTGGETAIKLVDNLVIYQGNIAKLDEPSVSGTSISVTGCFDNNEPGSAKARQLTLLTATYDKEYGYTTQIREKKYVVNPGKVQKLNYQFNLPGFDYEKQNVTTMIWDDAETGVPLASATGYVMADSSNNVPNDGQEVGLDVQTIYNEVSLSGYIGVPKGVVTATLMKDGQLCAAIQAVANSAGMINTKIGIDPEMCASGSYTLRLQYGNRISEVVEPDVVLYTNDIISEQGILNEAAFKTFVENYDDNDAKDAVADRELLPYIFKNYQKIFMVKPVTNVYELQSSIEKSIANGRDEVALLAAVNEAVANKKWSEVEKLMSVTYKEFLGYPSNATNGVLNVKNLFLRMKGGYLSAEELMSDFYTAKNAQIAVENAGVSGGNVGGGTIGGSAGGGFAGAGTVGGGSAGGGAGGYASGSVGGGAIAVDPNALPDSVKKPLDNSEITNVTFADLDSVPWAEESIEALRNMGVISGDGDGNFAPDRPVSREEFLKIAMSAAGISVDEKAMVSFEDVNVDAWYYAYVATAFEQGIINGMSESFFGIGQQITRADMAVILDRILTAKGVGMDKSNSADIFEDWMKIPVYARGSVAQLCAEGLLHGVGNNLFSPLSNATRAEAAVAVYRIYGYMNEGR